MKKLVLLVASLMFTVCLSQAQTVQEKKVKSELRSLDRKHDPKVKEEKKNLRHELRKLEGNDVSESSQSEFHKDYGVFPDEKWERTANYDKVNYTKNGQSMVAYYDGDYDNLGNSTLIGILTDKKFSDLPAKAQETINTKYKAYTKSKILFFEDNVNNDSEMVMFGHQLKDANNYFMEMSKDGKNIVLSISKNGDVDYYSNMK